VGKVGFVLTYRSHRALEADHAAYMTHGGMLVGCEESQAPSPGSDVTLRIAVADRSFDIPARAGNYIKNRGMMLSFEDDELAQADALEQWIGTEEFRAVVRGESEGSVSKPAVERFMSGVDSPRPPSTTAGGATSNATAARPRRVTSQSQGVETELRFPESGEKFLVYVLKFSTLSEYVEALVPFESSQIFPVPIEDPEATVNTPVQLRLNLPGHSVYEIWGVIEKVDPKCVHCRCDENDDAYRRAVLHPSTVHSKARLARETPAEREGIKVIRLIEEMPEEDPERMPIRRRLARMGMDDKINMALSGDREERMALAMDSNKAVHHYLLKNARITLDEIAFMARLPSLNPDVLERIAEIPAYTQNPTIAKALVYNPRTPVQTAIRLLDRLPRAEVMNLAKRTNMNLRLVMAAKKRLEKRST
jgi:hypothetical protein